MVKSRREFKCSLCGLNYIKWQGICKGCGKASTIQKIELMPQKPKTNGSSSTKRLLRRAKDSERTIGKRMLSADGADPLYRNIASSTGRIGFITNMRVDAVSRTYITENKNRKLPLWVINAWVLLNQKGDEFQKNILLHIDPPNMPNTYPVQGITKKLDTMAIIKQERHEDLIQTERLLETIVKEIFTDRRYEPLQTLYFETKERLKG